MANTIGIEVVARFTMATAPPIVTITSTFCCTSSAAISATRSARPSDHRRSIETVRSSTHPSSSKRSTKATNHLLSFATAPPRYATVGSLPLAPTRAAATQPPCTPNNCNKIAPSHCLPPRLNIGHFRAFFSTQQLTGECLSQCRLRVINVVSSASRVLPLMLPLRTYLCGAPLGQSPADQRRGRRASPPTSPSCQSCSKRAAGLAGTIAARRRDGLRLTLTEED